MHLISTVDVDLNKLSPESAVIPVYGDQENPQLSALEVFLRSEEAKRFKEKFGGATREDQEKWFQKWLYAAHVRFKCSPKQAFENGREDEVLGFVKGAIR